MKSFRPLIRSSSARKFIGRRRDHAAAQHSLDRMVPDVSADVEGHELLSTQLLVSCLIFPIDWILPPVD